MDTLRGDAPLNPNVLRVQAKRESELLVLPIERRRPIRGGNNITELVDFRGDGNGIFKPGIGEDPLEIPESRFKLFKREVASYLTAEQLHPGLVPPTVLRNIDGVEGSMQDFVPDPKQNLWDTPDPLHLSDKLFGLSIFDYTIWNKDRKPANFFVRSNLTIAAIDNGLSFDRWEDYDSSITYRLIKRAVGKPIPDELIKSYGDFSESSSAQDSLRSELIKLVPGKTVDAMIVRAKFVHSMFSKGIITRSDIARFAYYPR